MSAWALARRLLVGGNELFAGLDANAVGLLKQMRVPQSRISSVAVLGCHSCCTDAGPDLFSEALVSNLASVSPSWLRAVAFLLRSFAAKLLAGTVSPLSLELAALAPFLLAHHVQWALE